MKKSKDRWESISNQLEKMWIDYERIEGTNPREMSKDELDNIFDREYSIKVHPPKWIWLSSIGCSHSHFKIYEKIVKEKIPFSLILEDDVVFDDKFKSFYDRIALWKSWGYDYISVNYQPFTVKYLKCFLKTKRKECGILKFILYFLWWISYSMMDFFPLILSKIKWDILIVKRYRPFYLTWAYFITYAWAKKLLSVHPKVFTVADYLPEKYRWKSKLKFYVSVPVLAIQNVEVFWTI